METRGLKSCLRKELIFLNEDYGMYYAYLISLIEPPPTKYTKLRQRGLLMYELFRREFAWLDTYPLEENRAKDGTAIRDHFLKTYDETPDKIPQGPCRVLEMLIAFAVRIDTITHDYTIGHRPWEFLEMFLINLGFDELTDTEIQPIRDAGYINDRLEIWMSHNITPDGQGGLFRFLRPVHAINSLTNWDQMNRWVIDTF